jgi:hypothetical protein
VVAAVTLIALWIVFFRSLLATSLGRLPPGAFLLPLLFCSLALGAARAALRGHGITVLLTGVFSLFPMGIFFVAMPGVTRVIGVLDLLLIATGIATIRRQNRAFDRAEAESAAVGEAS